MRPSLVLAIEDAILLGHVKEIDAVLASVENDDAFPEELRAGLESLRHYRAYYGKGSASEPQDEMHKKQTALMEAAWGAELLDMLRNGESAAAKRA